jgi:branched-chain amino acid transport system ATP-binding protein
MSAGPGSPILETQHVTVRFGGVTALDDVGFSVNEAEVVGLVGPNGAGKTTLFGVVSGLTRPQSGWVRMRGVEITRATPQRRSRLGLARTFQRLELFTELTVREHLTVAQRVRERRDRRFWMDLVGFGARPSPGERERGDAILDLLELDDAADRPVALLPLGVGRLVEVARAIATDPAVLLLDEPTSGLDAHETERLAAALIRARDQRRLALVLVEHNVELVLAVANRVTVLDFGKVIASGTPEQIRTSEAVRSAYFGASDGVQVE